MCYNVIVIKNENLQMGCVMNTDKLFSEINRLALKEIELYGGPLIIHYNISLEVCERFAEIYNVDPNIVKSGIALADIKVGYCMKNGIWPQHIQKGYEYAEEILNKLEVDEKTKELLLHCVLAHHGDIPYKSIEAEIVANSDCYRFLTPAGTVTHFQFATKKGLTHNDAIDMVLSKIEEKMKIVSLKEAKEELTPYYQSVTKFLQDAKV